MHTELGPRIEESGDFDVTAQEIAVLYPKTPEGFTISGNAGSIYDDRLSEIRKIGIPAGCGVVANKDQENLTESVVGCAVLYLEGAKSNIFVHLTPNEKLGYRYYNFGGNAKRLAKITSEKIVASLPKDEDRASMQGIMIVNIGSETGSVYENFDYRKILADAERFVGLLKQAGVGDIKVVEVPLNSTSVYTTPLKKGKVFVCGTETLIGSEGGLRYSKDVRGFWIDADPKNKTEYVDHNVLERAA